MEKRAMRSTTLASKNPGPTPRAGEILFRRYLGFVIAAILTALSGVLAITAAVDPLWYWRGNIVTGENFSFNERFAKLNHLLRDSGRYDCLIFGSSRVTLFDQTRITEYTCANLSFSGGVVSEFVIAARYIKALGFSPKLVIVGVDAFNFWREMNNSRLPEFIERGELPPGWVRTYLSASALNFSLRTLASKSPMSRAYDANFVGKVDEVAPTYHPPALGELVAIARNFEASRIKMFFELRGIFPEARFVGYVPPISAWRNVEELHLTGYINQYLEAMITITERFDVMYDFSAPSDVTMRPENSYDEDHYRAPINAKIADVLQGRSNDFGIKVSGITLSEYTRIYNDAIIGFLNSIRDNGPRAGQ